MSSLASCGPAFRLLFALACLALGPLCAVASSAPAAPLLVQRSDDAGLRLAVAIGDTAWTVTRLRPDAPPRHELRLDGFFNAGDPGRPLLPRHGGWVVVPPGMQAELAVVAEEWSPLEPRPLMIAPTPVAGIDPETGGEFLTAELLLPGEAPRGGRLALNPQALADVAARAGARAETGTAAALGEPAVWRGRRIAPLTIIPLQADAEGNALRLLRSAVYEVRFTPDQAATRAAGAVSARQAAAGGRADERFGSLFLNPEALGRWPAELRLVPADGDEADRLLEAYAPVPGGPPAYLAGGARAAPARARAAAMRAEASFADAHRGAVLLGPEVRLSVGQTRLYRVTAAGLAARGLLPAGVTANQIRLYQRRFDPADPQGRYLEVEVPIRLLGDGGVFASGDAFLFYGLRPRDDGQHTADLGAGPVTVPGCGDPHENNNGGNIYWLAFADPEQGRSWARMQEIELAPAAGPPLPHYRRVDYFEEDLGYQEFLNDASRDRYHWNSFRDQVVERTVPVYAADPDAGDARVRAGLVGYNNSSSTRLVDVNLVGAQTVLVGSINLDTVNERVVDSGETLSGALLAGATVTLRARRQTTGAQMFSFLDWFELSYRARYQAVGDALAFHAGEDAGDRDLEVAGFTRADLGLIEVTDPRRPVWIVLTPGNVLGGGPYTLSLRAPQGAGVTRRFVAAADMAGAGVAEFLYFRATAALDPRDPRDAAGNPELLVVTHGGFRAAAERWLSHRRLRAGAAGLQAHVVDVQDLYDWFSGGLKDPWAIRRFVLHALDAWGSRALQLVGDANENVRAIGVTDGTTDWVPTRLHGQWAVQTPELLAADAWYVTPGAGSNYPRDTLTPPELLVGRFPCNSVAELDVMIDKVIAAESGQGEQPWRRRAIFIADDAWSYGYGDQSFDTEVFQAGERWFQTSEDSLAARWDRFAGGAQTPQRFFLSTYLDPYLSPGQTVRNTQQFQQYTASDAVPPLLSLLTQGALLVHYQGHANARLMAHEVLIQDIRATPQQARQDVLNMNNGSRAFVFFGMACHISDWAQNTADRGAMEPSLGEKMLLHPGGAACAVYASSGYEFLLPNVDFSELQFRRWLDLPPRPSPAGRTRWVLGELMLHTIGDVLARYGGVYGDAYREMVAQYALLGDALLALDCGPPQVAVTLDDAGGAPLVDGQALAALNAGNVRALRITARDEAGVDRLVVLDSAGDDLTNAVTPETIPGQQSDQLAVYRLDLPVRPFDHEVTLHVYDTARSLPADDHPTLTVRLPQTITFYRAGHPEPVDPDTLLGRVGEPVALTAVVVSSAWIDPDAGISIAGENVQLSAVSATRRDERTIDLAFTATIEDESAVARALRLTVRHTDGRDYVTVYPLRGAPPEPTRHTITFAGAFPNPMREQTAFLFRTTAPPAAGRVLIYTVSGRKVAALPVSPSHFADGAVSVPWSGRDADGDALANGVYLYRLELSGPEGELGSEMQKLVVMR